MPIQPIIPEGELFLPPDVDAARQYFKDKPRAMTSKLMPVRDAVSRFIHDGDYLASGGFGGVRIATALLHEIVRQRIHNLGFCGHCSTHDFQILCAGECIDRCDIAYVVGLETRGLSLASRRWMESGRVRMTEWSNLSLGWRYKAAAMGVPFLPVRSNLGTDTLRFSASKVIDCPFTGEKLVAVPALFPDVCILHVHRADIYGNAQVDGITIVDSDMVRASKRVIISAERIVPTDEIRCDPARTIAPYWLVDAVCHVPYGSFPGNMPYEYYSDEDHLAEWLAAEKDPTAFAAFLDKYIYGVATFEEYLERAAGRERLEFLRSCEPLKRVGGAA